MFEKQKQEKIPIPFRVRVRDFACAVLPAIVFGSTVAGVGLMWRSYITPRVVPDIDQLRMPPRPAAAELPASNGPASTMQAIQVEFPSNIVNGAADALRPGGS